MRLPTLILALAGALSTSGCSTLVSLNPFTAAQEAVFDRNLPAIWSDEGSETTYAIRPAGDGYFITYIEKREKFQFDARLFRIGDARLLDLVAKSEDPFTLPVHLLMRVWSDGPTL